MDYIGKNRPHLVILLGPFVDTKQPLIDECNTNGESFDEIFNRLIAMIHSLLEDLPMTQFILQPRFVRLISTMYYFGRTTNVSTTKWPKNLVIIAVLT